MSMQRKSICVVAAIVIIILGSIVGWEYSGTWLSAYEHSQPGEDQPLKGVPILMYHKINPDPRTGGLGLRVHPHDFNWQMHYLKENGYHTIDLSDVINKGVKLPEKPIVITIDDGYYDNYRYAYPILIKYGFTATVFVVTNTVGGFNDFDYKAHIKPKTRMLTWDEIKEMNHNGITIGSHTLDHVHLTKVKPEEAQRQIIESKKILEQKLGKSVPFFCYPYGEYNQAVAEMVKESGYTAATSTIPGLANAHSNPYLLERIIITGHFNHQRFMQELHSY